MLITWLTAANSCAVGLVTLTVESDDRKRLAATKVCYINVQPQGIFFPFNASSACIQLGDVLLVALLILCKYQTQL